MAVGAASTAGAATNNHDDFFSLFDDDAAAAPDVAVETLDGEFERYLVIRKDKHADPLGWWKAHAALFPNLSRMARDFLGCTGSEAESERTFSSARRLITWERCRLAGTTIRAAECVKSWMRL